MSNYQIEADLITHILPCRLEGQRELLLNEKKLASWVLTLHGSDVNIYPYFSAASKAFKQTVQAANQVIAVVKVLESKS